MTVRIDRKIDPELVTAERIYALGRMRCTFEFAEVPRAPGMIENEFTIEIAQFFL
jgi:hypothetical protein